MDNVSAPSQATVIVGATASIPVDVQSTSSGWSTVNVSTTINVTNASIQLLAANENRKYLYIANNDTQPVYLQLGNSAIYGRGIRLNNGAVFIMSGSELFLGEINAIGIGPVVIDVLEGV